MLRGGASGERGKAWGIGDEAHVTCSGIITIPNIQGCL